MKHITETAAYTSILTVAGIVVFELFFDGRNDRNLLIILAVLSGGFVWAILWGVTVVILKIAMVQESAIQFVLFSGIIGMLAGAMLGIFFGAFAAFLIAAHMVIVALVVVRLNRRRV